MRPAQVAGQPVQLDWHGPWLAPHAAHAAAVTAGLQRGLSVAQVLNELSDGQAPVRFVPQSDLPPGQAYEAYIFEYGACPTRDNLHDLFNGLSWLAFPRTKARLNALQAAQPDLVLRSFDFTPKRPITVPMTMHAHGKRDGDGWSLWMETDGALASVGRVTA